MTATYPIPGYPSVVLADDMEQMIVRPMAPKDEAALLDFFRRIPEGDRRHLKEDVASQHVIHRWATEIDYSLTIPLLAFFGDKVVADGTLHHRRAENRKHVGEIRIVVDPDYRNKGIGRALMRRLIEIARDERVDRLIFEVVADAEPAALYTAKLLGFAPVAILRGHSRDALGLDEDVVVMELDATETEHVPKNFCRDGNDRWIQVA